MQLNMKTCQKKSLKQWSIQSSCILPCHWELQLFKKSSLPFSIMPPVKSMMKPILFSILTITIGLNSEWIIMTSSKNYNRLHLKTTSWINTMILWMEDKLLTNIHSNWWTFIILLNKENMCSNQKIKWILMKETINSSKISKNLIGNISRPI